MNRRHALCCSAGGVMPLCAPRRRIREHNALLFDFVLKRQLRAGTSRLPKSVFETRGHFATGLGYIAAKPAAQRVAASRTSR